MTREPVDGTRLAPERAPGDFYRYDNGQPRVAHPTAMLKDGSRPKWAKYGRPSSLGKNIGNGYLLSLYQQRMVAVGMATEPLLVEQARELVGLTNDDPDFREMGDRIAKAAQDAAKAGLAADRGTHVHALTEDHDTDGDPIARMERGETLGLTPEAQHALVTAWRQFLDHYGLEVLATEAQIVNDSLRVAGTLDRIVRATRDVTVGYEVIPAGTVFVLDIKTGKLRIDDKTGKPMWWHDYAIQVWAYASGRPYDTATDTRGDWPFEVDQRIAAICHLDVRAAMAGEAVATLITVDLAAGRVGADLVAEVQAWGDRTDLFVIDADPVRVAVTEENTDGPAHHDRPTTSQPHGVEQARPTGDDVCNGSVLPVGRTDDRPTGRHQGDAQADQSPAVDRAAQRAQLPTGTPDEGDRPHVLEVDTWKANYEAVVLDNAAAKSWARRLAEDAMTKNVSFHMNEAVGGKVTERRLSILMGLTRMVSAQADDDDTLRSLLALTVGADWPFFANVLPGEALGLLNATQAATFAAHADALGAGRLVLAGVDPDGNVRLRPAA